LALNIPNWYNAGMVTAELINYIKRQIASGQTSDVIKATLSGQGWSETDIRDAFIKAGIVQSTEPVISTTSPAQIQPEKPSNIFDFKKMKWHEWLALIPAFFLLVQGGAAGAAIGILGWSLSLKVMRNENISGVRRVICVLGITVGYILVYFIIGLIFIGIIKGVG
jgi:hypothetical protein